MPRSPRELAPGELRWRCDPDSLGFETTDDFRRSSTIIGQDRALEAIRLGLEMPSKGYNIFVSGQVGTGKTAAVSRVLETIDLRCDDLTDICYVHNFDQPDCPVCLILPAGSGRRLKARMNELLASVRDIVPAIVASESYRARQAKIVDDVKKRRDAITTAFEKELAARGFSIVAVDVGEVKRPVVMPVVAGEPVSMEQLSGLATEGKLGRRDHARMRAAHPKLSEHLEEVLLKTTALDRELNRRVFDHRQKHLEPLVAYTIEEVGKEFDGEKVMAFLRKLSEWTMKNIAGFIGGDDEEPLGAQEPLPFDVNVLVDNAGRKKAPVVIEQSAGFVNLFGTIERRGDGRGDTTTDFTMIRPGALHLANGGYLVVNLADLFEEPFVYNTFKRALKNRSHQIRTFDSMLLAPIGALKPEAIPLDVKVVVIGDAYSYSMLYEYDDDFQKIFKVKAEFDSVMPNARRNHTRYARFIHNMCVAENLPSFHKSAVAAIIEEGVRLAGRRNKITTQFSEIGDAIREAAYWARKSRSRAVRDRHVARALEARERRVSLYEDKMQEMFDEGTILLDTRGLKVGQVNGLAVFDLGDHSFGRPTRITAESGVGRAGVINIEREAEMSGRSHNKGMLILEGYLRRMYAHDKPITVSASVCFEQAYSGIDGDSASSAEVYAILSSIGDVPVRQDIAVTGSVNQKGEIQPIGGVNEKIEGFFDVCRFRGLSGTQGVMIPALNRNDLMLRPDVVNAVRRHKFHIYAVRTIDEGTEILTGVRAGRRLKSGRFQRDTVHCRVDEALRMFQEQMQTSENGDDGHGDHK